MVAIDDDNITVCRLKQRIEDIEEPDWDTLKMDYLEQINRSGL